MLASAVIGKDAQARHSVFRYVEAKSKAPALHKPGGLFLTGRSLETTPSNGKFTF